MLSKKKRKKENCLLGDQKKVPLLHIVNHFMLPFYI